MREMRIVEANLEALEMKYGRLSVRAPAAERKLLASLGEAGQQSPVIVVVVEGRYVVIDGHKRVRALEKLKADVVKVAVWELGEAEALATSYQMSAQGGRNAFEEGWLVAELHRGWGWSLGQVGERLVRSKSWVSRRLALVEALPDWVAEEVASGRIGAHAAANFLVPLTRGNDEAGRALAEKVRGLNLTNRQMGELYACYRSAGVATRRKIVEDPMLYLKARAAARLGDAELGEKASRCVRNMALVGNVSLGLARGLPEVLGYDAGEIARERLLAAWRRCREHFEVLAKTVEGLAGEAGHDRSADTGGDTGVEREGARAS
jgi:ParB family transcriptional regulator, chromosome partitioning protein